MTLTVKINKSKCTPKLITSDGDALSIAKKVQIARFKRLREKNPKI